ncbi:hypothetical protein WS71_07510 [Burkholderia mayonis]|uniref:Uncharacterized protein n=1 Tax=Burkholderia mayonis TaxID=1385591 RepID=A0A1B4FU19_9BURK|nr:hypothetical protein WS71_07510 [Burkholderia mayonis]KVE52565.1 hypothetical protein WS71_09095 [Burkholderia mayonis]
MGATVGTRAGKGPALRASDVRPAVSTWPDAARHGFARSARSIRAAGALGYFADAGVGHALQPHADVPVGAAGD